MFLQGVDCKNKAHRGKGQVFTFATGGVVEYCASQTVMPEFLIRGQTLPCAIKNLNIRHFKFNKSGVAPEVNIREYVIPPPSMNKAAHSGFETQRRRHQKSKTGVSMAPQKVLQKLF